MKKRKSTPACNAPKILGDSLAALDSLLVPITTDAAFWRRLSDIMADASPPKGRQ